MFCSCPMWSICQLLVGGVVGIDGVSFFMCCFCRSVLSSCQHRSILSVTGVVSRPCDVVGHCAIGMYLRPWKNCIIMRSTESFEHSQWGCDCHFFKGMFDTNATFNCCVRFLHWGEVSTLLVALTQAKGQRLSADDGYVTCIRWLLWEGCDELCTVILHRDTGVILNNRITHYLKPPSPCFFGGPSFSSVFLYKIVEGCRACVWRIIIGYGMGVVFLGYKDKSQHVFS